jgi:hypothetical protein
MKKLLQLLFCLPLIGFSQIILVDDFSNPANWVIDHDSTACSLDWQIGVNSCQGSYPIDDILSTTAANGYAMIDSDAYGGATGGYEVEDCWLTMANPVNLNGYPNIDLEFETQHKIWYSCEPYVVVGIGDGSGNVIWPDLDPYTDISMMDNVFKVFPGWSVPVETTNPQLITINISSALVGLTSTELADIYIRFHWTGTWGYACFVDDVSISETPNNKVVSSDEVMGGWWIGYQTVGGLGQDYTFNPMSQAAANPYAFESVLRNGGIATQDVTMHVEVTEDATAINVFSSTSYVLTLATGEQDTVAANATFAPTSGGLYNIEMWSEADSAGAGLVFTNTDITTKTTEVTDYVYGKDMNSYDGSWRLSRTGLNYGGFEIGADYDIYANTDLYSIDVFIADYSIPGTEVYATLYEIDPWGVPIWLDISDDYTLQAGEPGTWINIPFLSSQPLSQGTGYCITIGGYMHPVDSAGVGVSGIGTYSFDRLFDKDGWYQNGAPLWYTIGDIPMLRMNFDPATQSYGCTDPLATNYDSTATVDDGSCVYVCNEDAPSNIYSTNVIQVRATINWDNMNSNNCTVDQYRIKYRAVGTSAWASKTMGAPVGSCAFGTNKTDKLLLNLMPATTYEYQMKAWYCGGGNSVWTALHYFTTEGICQNIINLQVSTPTTTKATFTWDSTATYSFVRIKARIDVTGSTWFNVGGFGVNYPALTKDKNGLTPGTSYRAQARTWCSPSGGAYRSAGWTPIIFWTQPTSIRVDGGSSINNLAIYPNPSRDVFNISFTSETVQNLKVRILNLIGEELVNEDLQQFVGEYTKAIDLATYTKGVYFLEITTNNGVVNKKLILQ